MLVISRRKNETIQLGPKIVVTVVSIHGDKVRLGIEAPQDVDIIRTELIPPGQEFSDFVESSKWRRK